MQGSRAPSFIAGNELIGCMCPRRCLGAGYGPNRSMIFGSLRSMALQKSRKVRSMLFRNLKSRLIARRGNTPRRTNFAVRIFSRKCSTSFAETVRIERDGLEPNFLISEATKKRRILPSSGSTEREEACAWSARNRARRPATLVTGARVGEGPRTRRRPGEPPVSRPGIARRLVPRSIGAMTFGKRHSRAVSNFYWNFPRAAGDPLVPVLPVRTGDRFLTHRLE